MDNEKRKLEADLRKAVGRAERGSSTNVETSASNVLAAIDKFILSWDQLLLDERSDGDVSDSESDIVQLPVDYLLEKFSCAAQILGYGNAVVREHVLATLQSVETNRCRQIVLDFLPATLPSVAQADEDDGNDGNAREASATRKQKKEVLSTLKLIFDDDASCLSQILHSLSMMTELRVIETTDGTQFVVEMLPKVPESDLHLAIQFLLKHIVDSEGARMAVESIRTELSLLEKTDISDMTAVAVIFGDFQYGDCQGSNLFLAEYVLMLETIFENHKTYLDARDQGAELEERIHLSTFDFAFILLNKRSSIVGERIEVIITDGIYEDLEVLPRLGPSRLADLVGRNNQCDNRSKPAFTSSSKIQDRTMGALVDFSMGLLLSPLRHSRTNNCETMFLGIQNFILEVLVVLDESLQRMFISSMIGVTNKLLTRSHHSNSSHNGNARSSDAIEKPQPQQTASLVCSNIYRILGAVVDQQPGCILEFHDDLVQSLKEDCLDFNNDETTLRNLCVLLTKMKAKHADKRTVEMHQLLICRTLLFSPSRDLSTSAAFNTRQRCVKGLVFAGTLIQDGNIHDSTLAIIWKFVAKLLSSPSHEMVHPEIGMHGVQIARLLHRKRSRPPTKEELFQCMTQVLSNSRLVQYCDDAKASKPKPGTLFWGYSKVPSFVCTDYPQRSFRKMIFCFNSFFRDENLWIHPSDWDLSCSWIFNLVDSYLAMGRTPKWIPHAWINGQFEIPLIAFQSIVGNVREKRIAEAIQMEFSVNEDFQNNNAWTSAALEKHLIELMKGIKKESAKHEVLRSAYRLAFSLLLTLSLSAAVLTNTFDHFKRTLQGDCAEVGKDERKEGYSLVEFQLLKIYDLNQKCQSMKRFFHFVASTSRKVTRRSSKKRARVSSSKSQSGTNSLMNGHSERNLALREMNHILQKIFHSVKCIPNEILWLALLDPSHDSIVAAAVENPRLAEEYGEKAAGIAGMRIRLLEHLGRTSEAVPSSYGRCAPLAIYHVEITVLREQLAQCLRLAAFLSLSQSTLRGSRQVNTLHQSLSTLRCKYLKLLCSIFVSKMNISPLPKDENRDDVNSDFAYFFGLFFHVLGSKDPLNVSIPSEWKYKTPTVRDFNVIAACFEEHIRNSDAATATQLLEILSIFATRMGSSAITAMVEINWKSMNKEFVDVESVSVISAPAVFTIALQKHGFTDDHPLERSIKAAVARLVRSWYKPGVKHVYLTQALGRQWGLLALQPREHSLFVTHVDLLLEKMVELLGDVEESDISEHPLLKDTMEALKDSDDDDDGEYHPPIERQYRKPTLPTPEGFPCLNSSNFSHYFDVVLRMVVLRVCLFSISDEASRVSDQSKLNDHPVHELENFINVFGDLMELLKNRIHVFPKSAIPSIISTSKCMLVISTEKLLEFIEWRNSQPISLSEENSGLPDIASTSVLKSLLDVLGINVVGRLRSLFMAPSNTKQLSEDELHRLFGHGNVSKVKSLSKKVEQVFELLCDKSDTYNLGHVKVHPEEQFSNTHDCEEHGSKRRRTSHNVLRKFENSTSACATSDQNVKEPTERSKPQQRPLRQLALINNMNVGESAIEDSEDEESYMDDDDDDDDDASSGDGDDFGVSGDWGQDSGSDEDEEYGLVQQLTLTS